MPEFNVKPSLYSVTFYSKNVTQFVTQSVENVPNKGKQQEKQNITLRKRSLFPLFTNWLIFCVVISKYLLKINSGLKDGW